MEIHITEQFKKIINEHLELSETKRVDHILTSLVEQGWVDSEYETFIFPEGENKKFEYNLKADLLVLDAIEDEIKRQLLAKFNE